MDTNFAGPIMIMSRFYCYFINGRNDDRVCNFIIGWLTILNRTKTVIAVPYYFSRGKVMLLPGGEIF